MATERCENEKAARDSQVSEWLNRAHKELEGAREIYSQFETRLDRILRTPGPTDKSDDAKAQQALVPLATELREIANGIRSLSDSYRSLIEHIEL